MQIVRFLWTALTVALLSKNPCLLGEDSAAIKAKVVQVLKGADSVDALNSSLKELKDAGASDQQIFETKLLWVTLKTEDIDFFQTFGGDAEKLAGKWNSAEGLLYHRPEQVMAAKHYMLALKAFNESHEAATKEEILEAIWLDPSNAKYYQKLKDIHSVPMDMKFQTVDGKTVTLGDYAKGKKALYIQVWATWCQPCLHLFPALTSRAKALPVQGVGVVAMNSELGQDGTDGGDSAKAKARKKEFNMQLPWLVEPNSCPITEPLGIDSVPRALVVDPQGKILFNNHPMNEGLVVTLKKLGVKINLKDGLQDGQ